MNEILFKGLPFQPVYGEVFYIENGYDKEANDFIRSHYTDLKIMFMIKGMNFYYMPYLTKEQEVEKKVKYYAPYLSTEQLVGEVQSNVLVPYIADAGVRATLKPSFLFNGSVWEADEVVFQSVTFDELGKEEERSVERLDRLVEDAWRNRFQRLDPSCLINWDSIDDPIFELDDSKCDEPLETSDSELDKNVFQSSVDEIYPQFSMPSMQSDSNVRYSTIVEEPTPNKEIIPSLCKGHSYKAYELDKEAENRHAETETDDGNSLLKTEDILHELRITVQKLRLEGVSLMAIHEFIDKQEPLSRMRITPDYRIFLPDYNNMEIEMGALPKAIYFLYLRYPEGIICKHMPDHFKELLNIYKQLRPFTDEARLNLTITKVVNPIGNALNENIARIRKAFVEKFDEHLANNYIISGERGLQYSIPLDRNLITWEE